MSFARVHDFRAPTVRRQVTPNDSQEWPFTMCLFTSYYAVMWYAGLDVHEATTSVSIRNGEGVVVRRDVVPTTRVDLRRFFASYRCRMLVAVEASALAPLVVAALTTRRREVIVCDGRRNRLLAHGSKTDRVDADKLSELLRLDALRPVFVGGESTQRLRRLSHHYLRLVADRTRVIQRIRAFLAVLGLSLTRSTFSRRAVPLRSVRDRSSKAMIRALLVQVEAFTPLIADARAMFLAEARSCPVFALLQTVPHVGPIRAAEFIAIVGEPCRFRSVRSFWAYAGLAVERRRSSEHRLEHGRVVRDAAIGGGRRLNRNCQPRLKKILKDVALGLSLGKGVLREIYDQHVQRGKRPAIARVVLARRIAGILLAMWKAHASFDPSRIKIRNNVRGEHQVERSSSVSSSPEVLR